MAEQVKDNGTEPVLAIPASKAMWLLIAVVVFLAYQVMGFTDHVEKVVISRAEKLYSVVDGEMDDVSDNYEESIQLILQNKCEEALIKYKETACKIEVKKKQYHDFHRLDGGHPNR